MAERSKKKLKSVGVDPRQVIVTGRPLFLEDYKLINPSISDKALGGIKKKCERLFDKIKAIKWEEKDFFFICDKENPTDKLIIEELSDISDHIGKKIQFIEIGS